MQNDEISGDTVAIYIYPSSLSINEALYCLLFLLLIFSRRPNTTISVYVKLQNWINHRAHVKDSQSYGVSSSHKEGWVLKNWCFWTVDLEKTLGSPLDCMEIKPVNSKGNQYWTFIGGTDAEAEAPVLWPPDMKSWLIGKDPNAGKDWRHEEKEMTEDEMAGWHHQLNGHEFKQALRDGEGQGSLVCCSPWGHKKSDTFFFFKSDSNNMMAA